MFYLKNQIIFIALFCIFSNFISTLNAGKDANNVDEDAKKDLNALNDLYGQIDNQLAEQSDNDDLFSSMMMLKKSNLMNDNSYNEKLNNVEWQPVAWQPSIDASIELPESAEHSETKKSEKKNINYMRLIQPKRTIYRPIRAQRCLKRGALCDPSANPIISCCSHSVCRCNFLASLSFSNHHCRCDRMSLIQKVWG